MHCPQCGAEIDGVVADALNALTDLLAECKQELAEFRRVDIEVARMEAGE